MAQPSLNLAQDYKSNHAQADIEAASPHRLIQLLMQRLLTNLQQADNAMAEELTAQKGELISASISIVDCLRASLSFDNANGVADNLERLYDFVTRELLIANLNNERDRLQSAITVISEIKSAWDGIDEQVQSP